MTNLTLSTPKAYQDAPKHTAPPKVQQPKPRLRTSDNDLRCQHSLHYQACRTCHPGPDEARPPSFTGERDVKWTDERIREYALVVTL